MKKFSFFALAAASLMLASCSNDDDFQGTVPDGTLVDVTFTADIADLGTRSYGDGLTARHLDYAVYNEAGNLLFQKVATFDAGVKETNVTIQLVTGEKYQIVFWAQDENNKAYKFDATNKVMTINYANVANNNESLDAFYTMETITVDANNLAHTATLTRPFAQINIATGDKKVVVGDGTVPALGKYPTTSSVILNKVPNTLNLLSGTVTGEEEVTLQSATLPSGQITVGTQPYDYLSMSYVLAPTEGAVISTVQMNVDSYGDNFVYTNIPVKRNYKTNIVGDLLTSKTQWTVIINPDWAGEENVNVWDGVTVTPVSPVTKTINGNSVEVYQVSTGAQLAYMAQQGPKDAYIELTNSIDLNGNEWIPLGSVDRKETTDMFSGTLDGAGHTISNFKASADGEDLCAALIASANNATIKNVKIAGANVKASDTAAGLVGLIQGSTKVENCEAVVNIESIYENPGSKIIGTCIGGLVGRVYGENCTIKNCTVSGSIKVNSGVNAQSKVGGVVGMLGTNKANGFTIENCTSNVEIYGTSDFGMGGILGAAFHNLNVTIKDCVNNGNITNSYTSVVALTGAAGILGAAQSINYNGANDNFVITNCTNNGAIKGYKTGGVGEIIGALVNATIEPTNCTENGSATVL